MYQKASSVEPLFQTPEQRIDGTATFRVYIDGAWRNIEGKAGWKSLPASELMGEIEKVYESSVRQNSAR
jgi:hypothetical protein